ncbi:IS701 family transposase [Solwaraspora sp. WMMA2101]
MVEAGRVEENLATLMGDLGACFARVEPLRQAGKYVRGLIADLPRKNCWTLAEHAGDTTPDRMQRLLERAVWDTDKAMGVVRDFAVARLADPDGDNTLIFDESGVEKTGTGTCGVTRQYVGCAGKVTNAVNLVNATYATRAGHALVGSRLWIPAAHLDDDARRAATGVPADTEFATKPRLATDLLTETLDAGVPVRWCTADAVYGRDRRLRDTCETRGIGYSLGVPCSFRITLPGWKTKIRADTAATTLTTDTAWQTMSCGAGSKGDRWYAWAWIATASPRHYLLVRRSLADPDDLAYFYCWIPERLPATLTALVRVTGRRWTIEEDHGFGKDHFGFDQFQNRLHTPIMRHIVLVMAALAVCAVTAADAAAGTTPPPRPTHPSEPPPADLGLARLTVVEIKRLYNLATRAWHSLEHHLRWSWWRRRHQARARWYHYRSRLT